MEPEFWIGKWRDNQIAFHEGAPNRFLARYVARLGEAKRVLVPLCGKAEDLAFLAGHGHQVLGIELVEDAVRAFFAEHGVTPTVAGNVYSHGAITLIASDFFAVSPAIAGPLDALYDRAAYVALPPDLRARYVAHVKSLVPAGSPGLLISYEYPPDRMTGPPFSIPDSEVHGHYAAEFLEQGPDVRPGREYATEKCWAIRV